MSVTSKEKLLKKLNLRGYRDAYVEESVKTTLAFQIRALREQRGWSQADLGKRMAMKQNAVSRLEDPDYGNLSVNTLLRAANAFDCALVVKLVSFSRLLAEFENVSPEALGAESFDDDIDALEGWANVETLNSSVLTVDPRKSVTASISVSKRPANIPRLYSNIEDDKPQPAIFLPKGGPIRSFVI